MIRIAAALVLASVAAAAPAESMLFENGRLFVAAKVNGVATEALLDSGAEATLIDPVLLRPKPGWRQENRSKSAAPAARARRGSSKARRSKAWGK